MCRGSFYERSYTHLAAQLLGVPGQQVGHASQGILAHALAVVTRLAEQLLDLTETVSRLPCRAIP
jgi:hypothetical protein